MDVGVERLKRTKDEDVGELGLPRGTEELEKVATFDADSSFFGVFELDIGLNGAESIKIGRKGILYKGVKITPLDVMVEKVPNGERLTFSAFVKEQTSVWAQGQVGLSERFEVEFVGAGSQVRGWFQRSGEGPLKVRGKRRDGEKDEKADVDSAVSDSDSATSD